MTPTIVPGQARNHGILDDSRPETVLTLPKGPACFPVLSMVTPKGELGQKTVPLKDFGDLYGDIQNTDSPYYNAQAALVAALGLGGQASIGVRRCTANKQTARAAIAVRKFTASRPVWQRDEDGQFKLDALTGKRIPEMEGEGDDAVQKVADQLVIEPIILDHIGTEFGALRKTVTNDGTVTGDIEIIPLFEFDTLPGDAYNASGFYAGVTANADWEAISRFVRDVGVFPYSLSLYERNVNGTPIVKKTLINTTSTTFTLFNAKDQRTKVRYSLRQALGAFTGEAANRPDIPSPAPFKAVFVYDKYLEALTREMYEVESEVAPTSLVYLEGVPFNRQMNPLTCTNHEGVPYFGIALEGATRLFNMNSFINATGGISPFLDDDGKLPVDVEGTYNFDPALGQVDQLDTKDAWTVAQSLILADIQQYRTSLEMADWTRNRQSILIDVGYNSEIKYEMIDMLNTRRDQIAIFQASFWLENNTVEERYSIANTLSTRLRLTPESERHGTPACRATIIPWDAKIINEETGLDFPCSIDVAHKFAVFGGNEEGMLSSVNSPDHGDNRHLSIMHSPTVDLEDDRNAANNFNIGVSTLRPYDNGGVLYRPALVTVYPYPDSVLKNLVTCFVAICCEKVIMDTWPLVSGDTTISDEDVAATVKDRSEETCRKRFGNMFKTINVDTYYDENQPNSRSVLQARGYIEFFMGKYMMEMDVVARNAADSNAA